MNGYKGKAGSKGKAPRRAPGRGREGREGHPEGAARLLTNP